MAANIETVESSIGRVGLDKAGSAVGAVRMDPSASYIAIPLLLQKYINEGDKSAWGEIKGRIDYTCENAGKALSALDKETAFAREVKARVAKGQKLFFKPNLVNPNSIDPVSHGPGTVVTMTPWGYVAAIMRWFHDELGITYHQMSLGEASTTMSAVAGAYTLMLKGKGMVTTQAVMEGKLGDFYGGWGFYFVRKYLAETHTRGHKDDPMRGYEESLAGACLPPAKAPDKLLVYDINKIDDDMSNGREVNVPGGVNFKSVILHKVVIGGDPADVDDHKNWPGCVLINVPKLKLHVIELITSAVKNLGIGLYPMEANASKENGRLRWRYAQPADKPVPGMKSLLPHQPWVPVYDERTGAAVMGRDGHAVMRKTGGMSATMADVISAVRNQGIYMVHAVDAIEATNGGQAGPSCVGVPEGYVFASCDPVAVDSLGICYLFKMVPVAEARKVQKEKKLPTDFLQKVPMPEVSGKGIIAGTGYDSPIPRYGAFRHCEDRGIGKQGYYVVGENVREGGRLASVGGHLGQVKDGKFTELLTGTLYYATGKPLHDLQATTFAYAEANDRLTGSDYKASVLAELDENGDGIIDYDEKGKLGGTGIDFGALGVRMQALDVDTLEMLEWRFLVTAIPLRMANPAWNARKIGMGKRIDVNTAVPVAMRLAQVPVESPDPLAPGMSFGKGKWPSIQYARSVMLFAAMYGAGFPNYFDVLMNPYGIAFRYAALKYGKGEYSGLEAPEVGGDALMKYHRAVAAGGELLPFTYYVPVGFGKANGRAIPNVTETTDPHLILTAEFDGGREKWQELNWEEMP
jgi:hypothetical protein